MSALQLIVATALAAGALAGVWSGARHGLRRLRVWAQIPLAALLYLGLFPPSLHGRGEVLNVITAGASKAQLRALPFGEARIALPGAAAIAGAEAVPDLATALRLHPQVRALHVVGNGLPPRDLPAAAQLPLRFDAAPAQGLVELDAPANVPLGQQWSLSGRLATAGAHIELHDPSGALVDTVNPDAKGRFHASAAARGEGPARFELHVIAAGQAEQVTSVPVLVQAGAHLSVLALEGAPGAEGKYWRHWAADAGIDLGDSIGLTQNVALHQGTSEWSAERLAATDVAIIDARGWDLLTATQKAALRNAVEQGLGLLLRADVPPSETTTADWAALGYRLNAEDNTKEVTLDRSLGLHDLQSFTQAPVSVAADGATATLFGDSGEPLAWHRDLGHGRVGLLRLIDSYQLQLIGEPAPYGTLWSSLLSDLARPRPPPPSGPQLPTRTWAGERAMLCGLDANATVSAPDQTNPIALSVGADGCAAYWPALAGWQVLHSGAMQEPLYVRADDDGSSLRAARDRESTVLLVEPAFPTLAPAPPHSMPLPRWPFLLAWLLLAITIWWIERETSGVTRRAE